VSRLSSTTLSIGDPAPPFSLPTLDGDRYHLGDAVRDGIALLVFVPGSWSPNARRQMTELAALQPTFADAAIGIVMIVTQDAGSLRRRLEATPPPFPVLADEDRTVARDYGVFRAVSWDGIGVTRPAAFVIDSDGAIRFVYVGERDSDTPDARSLLRLATWLCDKMPWRAEDAELAEVELEAQGFAVAPAPGSARAGEATAVNELVELTPAPEAAEIDETAPTTEANEIDETALAVEASEVDKSAPATETTEVDERSGEAEPPAAGSGEVGNPMDDATIDVSSPTPHGNGAAPPTPVGRTSPDH
jgi:peroxiredoxin